MANALARRFKVVSVVQYHGMETYFPLSLVSLCQSHFASSLLVDYTLFSLIRSQLRQVRWALEEIRDKLRQTETRRGVFW